MLFSRKTGSKNPLILVTPRSSYFFSGTTPVDISVDADITWANQNVYIEQTGQGGTAPAEPLPPTTIDGGNAPASIGTRVLLRGGTAAAWNSANPVLATKEIGVETDTSRLKIGDGITAWASLVYMADAAGSIGSIPADGAVGTPSLRTIGPGANQAGSGAQVAANTTSVAANTTAIATKASNDSPGLTGVPTAPTAASGTATTQLSTTAFVSTAITNLIAAAPLALDTLGEIATQLASDESAAGALVTTVAGKAPLASPALSGTPTTPTAAAGTNTTQVASTAFVAAAAASITTIDGGTP